MQATEKHDVNGAEFLSHFRKEDKIKPVLTFVFFYGDEWDGNIELYDMLEWNEDADKEIKQNLINYFGYDEGHAMECMYT